MITSFNCDMVINHKKFDFENLKLFCKIIRRVKTLKSAD